MKRFFVAEERPVILLRFAVFMGIALVGHESGVILPRLHELMKVVFVAEERLAILLRFAVLMGNPFVGHESGTILPLFI